MDRERAKFILQSFRPDGADAEDRDFADALGLAMHDRGLGEWLARERAFDAAFSRALAAIELPEDLRDGILRCLANERGDARGRIEDAFDGSMAGALLALRPPQDLRDRILVAMERTAREERAKAGWWKRAGIPLAAAAGIALALLAFPRESTEARGGTLAARRVPIELVEAGFVKAYESPGFALDMKRKEVSQLVRHLRARELPCAGGLPKGLENVPGIGCCELVVGGKRGSVICFDTRDHGVVHLVIFRRDDVAGEVPGPESPELSEKNGWAAVRWAERGRAFVLLGHGSVADLAGLL